MPGGAQEWRLVAEGGQRGQRGKHGDSDRQAGEALDKADAEALVQSDDDRVGAERVALMQQL